MGTKQSILLICDCPKMRSELHYALFPLPVDLVFQETSMIRENRGKTKSMLYVDFDMILMNVTASNIHKVETIRQTVQQNRKVPFLLLVDQNVYDYDRLSQLFDPLDIILHKPLQFNSLMDRISSELKKYNSEFPQGDKALTYLQYYDDTNLTLRRKENVSFHDNLRRIGEQSELQQLKEELTQMQDQFEYIFYSGMAIMLIVDAKKRQCIQVNESFEEKTGYSKEEVEHRKLDFLKIEILNSYQFSVATSKGSGIRYKTKEGIERYGNLLTCPIIYRGEECELIMIHDYTDMKIWHENMERMDQLNLIGELAAGIAHEIRNPMTTIRGFLQISKQANKIEESYIDLMLEELARANEIIREYLSLVKDEPSTRKYQDINQIIRALYPLIEAEALLGGKVAQLDLNTCPRLFLNEKEIRQLILNIAINGLEAMAAGGLLTIRTYCEHEHVVMEIIDEGCGIEAEDIKKLSTPFFSTKEHGTGLGLPVCYRIADKHDGMINVSSSEKGTIFKVLFPNPNPDK